jgi:hypothetical protein
MTISKRRAQFHANGIIRFHVQIIVQGTCALELALEVSEGVWLYLHLISFGHCDGKKRGYLLKDIAVETEKRSNKNVRLPNIKQESIIEDIGTALSVVKTPLISS